MKMTVNESMVLIKTVKGRLAELSSLRSNSASRETRTMSGEERKIEPLYDVKALDTRCTELRNFLLTVESKIKQSNAVTTIEVDADTKELLAPIE